MIALVQTGSVWATDFAVRQVTNLGTPTSGLGSPTPLGVVNDRLLFTGSIGGVQGLYRTDGTSVELIENSLLINSGQVARIGSELFFPASGPDGLELYA